MTGPTIENHWHMIERYKDDPFIRSTGLGPLSSKTMRRVMHIAPLALSWWRYDPV